MEKKLNIERIKTAMEAAGLNQAGLSKKLEVSRAIVTSWLKGDKFPRPDKLLKLGLTLSLPFQDLVEKQVADNEPIVAFRKKATRKTRDTHLAQAKEMGRLLELLVPYIPFNRMFQPPALKTPILAYDFIQRAAKTIRLEMGLKNTDPIQFEQLISKINAFEVILIPVFHGSKENHENALHIYLPSSKTAWIYLNLDSNILDFKFWMAHELGHVLSPSLSGDTAEDFADAFAQALLFPKDHASEAYVTMTKTKSKKGRINKIIEISKVLMISPVTVYKAIKAYAKAKQLPPVLLEPDIYAATANLNKAIANVSMTLCRESSPSVDRYIEITKTVFHSPFFDILRVYLSENEKSSGFIQSILDTSVLDAKAIHAELVG